MTQSNTETFQNNEQRLKRFKRAAIEIAFASATMQPVNFDGNDFTGGLDTIVLITAAKQAARYLEQNTVTVYTASNEPIVLTVAEAAGLIDTLHSVLSTLIAQKHSRFVDITAAASQEDLDAITW